MKDLLLDEAFRVFQNAMAGNMVSAVVFNEWALAKGLPMLGEDATYHKIKTYEDFYNLNYLNDFID